jgi:hypothetical protein
VAHQEGRVIEWYAVAYDVAGGIHAWSGPHRWRRARAKAERFEQSEYVRYAIAQQWMVSLQPDAKRA